jgi:hypothetical protein
MQTVSRRGFLVIGGTGAAGAVLAGCGGSEDDPRGEGRDAELLAAALAAETALGEAYADAAVPARPLGGPSDGGPTRPGGPLDDALTAFGAASSKRSEELSRLVDDAGGEPAEPSGDAIAAANATIAAYRAAAGPLSTAQLRGTAIAFLAAVAAELSVLLGFIGEDRVPRAFVTGAEAEPYLAADEDSADEQSETTTTETDQTTTEEQP